MKRVLPIAVIFLALLTFASCITLDKVQHKALERAVNDVRQSHDLLLPQYIKYVDEDGSLSADQKDDEKKFVESLKRLDESLKTAVKALKPKEE